MKLKLIILTILTFSIYSYGQKKPLEILPIENGTVIYTDVIKVDGIGKIELYKKAKKWFVINYKSSKHVIQLDDIDSGELIGKGNFKIKYYSRNPRIEHTISIFAKNNRYKYTITDFKYSDKMGDEFSIESFPKSWFGKKKLYNNVNLHVKSVISSLEKYMKTNNDDW